LSGSPLSETANRFREFVKRLLAGGVLTLGNARFSTINVERRKIAMGRLHSVTNGCFRKAQLQGPLFGNEFKKRSVMSRPVVVIQLPRLASSNAA
jgi:hypothetical protein